MKFTTPYVVSYNKFLLKDFHNAENHWINDAYTIGDLTLDNITYLLKVILDYIGPIPLCRNH